MEERHNALTPRMSSWPPRHPISTSYCCFGKDSLTLATNGGCMPSAHDTHVPSYSCPGFLQSGTQCPKCPLPPLMESRGAGPSFCKSSTLSSVSGPRTAPEKLLKTASLMAPLKSPEGWDRAQLVESLLKQHKALGSIPRPA